MEFNAYLDRFGLGKKLDIDVPGELAGNYPTPGGVKVVNQAFVSFYEGDEQRPYDTLF